MGLVLRPLFIYNEKRKLFCREKHKMKTAVVTGGSSGIGLRTAEMLRDAGYKVFELSRREHKNTGIKHIGADVTDTNALAEAFAEIIKCSGTVDLVVCCAGMGVSGAVEFLSDEETRRQFDVNFFGTVNTVRAVLPYMRRARSGKIICISSVAAVYSIPFQAYYSASKAAVNLFVDALTNEVRPFGIEVASVMPGDIKTGFTAARRKTVEGDTEYGGRISKAVSAMEKDETNGMSPDSIARFVLKLAEKKHLAPLYTVGAQYKALVALSRVFTHRTAVKIVGKLY